MFPCVSELEDPERSQFTPEYPLHKPCANTPGAGFFTARPYHRPPMKTTSSSPSRSPSHPLRVLKFTDTLADINGVCRFIQNIAQTAHDTNHDLRVFTSTRMEMPEVDNLVNFEPFFAMKMPKYDTLDLALPPLVSMLRAALEYQPNVIHISTPGPVGAVGMLAAKLMRVPIVGVYHTDFPAYIDELFDNRVCSWACRMQMRLFYKQFRFIFSRSSDYASRLVEIGLDEHKLVRLIPGFDNTRFDATLRDQQIWESHGISTQSVKAVFCGRVSTEKNLPMLVSIWPEIRRRVEESNPGKQIELIIIGDGPYRKEMQTKLANHGAHFLGFKHGTELAALYASCDLFLFPSTTDTLGQVVMESQASGLPVIITDQGGPKEVVDDQHSPDPTACIIPIDNTQGWIDTVVELAIDDARRKRMGDAGVKAMKNYTFAASFDHYWQIHELAR